MRIKTLGFILLYFSACFQLMAELSEENQSKEVIVTELHWVLKNRDDDGGAGLTRETALFRAFRIRENDWFRSGKHLERRMDTGVKELQSRHLFRYLNYEIIYSEVEDYLEAEIYVFIVDRLNLFGFPRAAYDSNLGMLYGGRLQYKNILGSLIDLDMVGYWSKEQWEITAEMTNLDFFLFQGNLLYKQNYEEVYLYNNQEQFEMLYSFQTSELKLKIDYPLAPGLHYYIMPGFLFTHSFDVIENPFAVSEAFLTDEAFFGTSFTHGLYYDHVRWNGNMREGYFLSLWNTYEIPLERNVPQIDLDLESGAYVHLGDFIGAGAGISTFYVINGERNNAGGKLRGVEDHLVYGKGGVFLNTAIDSRSIYIDPVVEIHLQPFVDAAYVVSQGENFVEEDNYFLTGGISLIIFPLPFKSLQVSVILGYDLLTPGPYELSVKTGLFF